ncbi:MAG TPA: putative Fe-S cluster assembly protein SufT [Gammaproteobacteria bacterium]|nr:putative Fe-S cluster assembly protein SufT [Gammaproteobacteria bacterium]
MYGREPVRTTRDVMAVLIPAGNRVVIPEGTEVVVTQAMGGTFTVYVAGNLARIEGEDADAIGEEPVEAPQISEEASDEELESFIWEQMKTCYDPEIPINIVDLGLVYSCDIEDAADGGKRVRVEMTLTAPGCGMGDILTMDVRSMLERIPQVSEADVELVFDPPWSQDMMSDEAKLQTGMM